LSGDIERCDVQPETSDLREKCIEVTVEARKVEGGEIGEPFEETMKKSMCWIVDNE
jgi:hypothetical protein